MPDSGPIAQRLLQFCPDGLIVVDQSGVILYANETCSKLFGYARSELIGQPMERLVPERFHIRHGAHVSNYLRDPTNREMGVRMSDLFARRADGTEFPAGILLAAFRMGEETLIAAAIRDVTERRQINEALIAAREDADRANRAKSRFLATASHDLRQPLQTVRMLNAAMLKLVESAELKDLLESQGSAIDSASRLLNALLDVSRLESGAVEPQLTSCSLSEIFATLRREFEPQAGQKGLRLEFPESRLYVNTDRILFAQLLQNLIGNALKYTDKGFVRVSERLTADDLLILIEDSGVGIPEDKLERIFDEYYQVGPQGTQRMGVGLGLAIVREVARILGYSIAVSSKFGEGTTVQVRLPVAAVCSNETSVPPPNVTADVPVSSQGKGRILLLEDNDSVRRATELFLSLEGFEVHSAASVAEAESLLAGLRAGDVLVTDYHLEGNLTGLDVLHQLRARHQWEVPAILLSGDLQAVKRSLDPPLTNLRLLSKPVDTQILLQNLDELRPASAVLPR